jgi:hypothetical protein
VNVERAGSGGLRVEIVVALGVLVVAALVLRAVLLSRFFWGLVIAGCFFVGATSSPEVTPWCIGVGVIALVAFSRLGRVGFGPVPNWYGQGPGCTCGQTWHGPGNYTQHFCALHSR